MKKIMRTAVCLFASLLLWSGCTKDSGKEGKTTSSGMENGSSEEKPTTAVKDSPASKENPKTGEDDAKSTQATGEKASLPEELQTPSLVFRQAGDVKKFMEGEWVYRHTPSAADMAWLTVSEDGTYRLKIINPKNGKEYLSEGKMDVADYTLDENGVPNVLLFQTTKFEYPYPEAEGGYSSDGDFVLSYKTLAEEEYIIELFQLNNGDTPLFGIFDSPVHVFRKTCEFQPKSSVQKSSGFYAICCKKDPERKRIWLDEVDFDENKKRAVFGKTMEAAAYEISGTIPDLFGETTEYLCELVHVVTDADGKVVSYETVDFSNDPWDEETEEGE